MTKMPRRFLRIHDIGTIGYSSFTIKHNFISLSDDFGLYVKSTYFFFIFTHAQVVLKYVKQKDSKHYSYILFL